MQGVDHVASVEYRLHAVDDSAADLGGHGKGRRACGNGELAAAGLNDCIARDDIGELLELLDALDGVKYRDDVDGNGLLALSIPETFRYGLRDD
jgi:hypothetical protein